MPELALLPSLLSIGQWHATDIHMQINEQSTIQKPKQSMIDTDRPPQLSSRGVAPATIRPHLLCPLAISSQEKTRLDKRIFILCLAAGIKILLSSLL